jgi:hypothetical protein
VTDADWAGAQDFLKKQCTVEKLNETVKILNQFLYDQTQSQRQAGAVPSPSKRSVDSVRVDTISSADMDRLVTERGIKVGLMQMKKLDMGIVGGVKVYTVKR